MRLTRFVADPPAYQVSQQRSLEWLAEAHAEAEATIARLDRSERNAFAARIARVLGRCACSPVNIGTRALSVPDLETPGFEDNVLYDLTCRPHGRGTATRTRLFTEVVDSYFATTYADEPEPPDELIHVTCTGYVSPSGAQKLVASRQWSTRVTHAYHMGCYAAVPAIRLAAGALATGAGRVDIAHTELCSLHLDPTRHGVEQLVVQSLFADGLIRYAAVADDREPGLHLLALHEQVVPDTAGSMGWRVSDWGMQMTLARDVPDHIASTLRAHTIELYRRAGVQLDRVKDSVAAVHPGGPKILDRVRDVLELDEAQLRTSRAVLFDHGNMSSATLPHIWMRIVEDPEIHPGTLVASFAFGPGLTVCSALFEKR